MLLDIKDNEYRLQTVGEKVFVLTFFIIAVKNVYCLVRLPTKVKKKNTKNTVKYTEKIFQQIFLLF